MRRLGDGLAASLCILAVLLWTMVLVSSGYAQAPAKPATSGNGFVDVVVGTATATILAPLSAQRLALTCTNNDPSNAVRVGAGYTPTATKGLRVGPGSVYVNWGKQAVSAIGETGSATLSCEEALP